MPTPATTTETTRDIIAALQNIEHIAITGDLRNPFAALTARLLALEVADSETQADALERAAAFIVSCSKEHRAA